MNSSFVTRLFFKWILIIIKKKNYWSIKKTTIVGHSDSKSDRLWFFIGHSREVIWQPTSGSIHTTVVIRVRNIIICAMRCCYRKTNTNPFGFGFVERRRKLNGESRVLMRPRIRTIKVKNQLYGLRWVNNPRLVVNTSRVRMRRF